MKALVDMRESQPGLLMLEMLGYFLFLAVAVAGLYKLVVLTIVLAIMAVGAMTCVALGKRNRTLRHYEYLAAWHLGNERLMSIAFTPDNLTQYHLGHEVLASLYLSEGTVIPSVTVSLAKMRKVQGDLFVEYQACRINDCTKFRDVALTNVIGVVEQLL